ncbi:arginase [Lysinibacillus halotolerans]|nr:arginase [Lysinibacillus halotolerans]
MKLKFLKIKIDIVSPYDYMSLLFDIDFEVIELTNSLLSIDWDYFISTKNQNIVSFVENKRTILDDWYKRYLQAKSKGINLQKLYQLSEETKTFWSKIKKVFHYDGDTPVFVSDSHALSYDLVKMYQCDEVFLFDAHSDLGYGGLSSLKFDVNCANWLGKLLHEDVIEQANIVYSPYTLEKPSFFKEINRLYNVNYLKFNDIQGKIKIRAIHICRSGAWSPPWFDSTFIEFINSLGLRYEIKDCPARNWNPNNISFSEQLTYLMA